MIEPTSPPLLSARGVTVRFGDLRALSSVDIDVTPGRVHALLGENGAGKTTLVRVLSGLERPDSGELLLAGRPVRFRSAAEAAAAGIGMVHQHDALIDALTVSENLRLSWDCASARRMSPARSGSRVARAWSAGERFGVALPDPSRLAGSLSVGERQRVEFARAFGTGARVLVLDEPTAVLTPDEADALLHTVRGLTAEGLAVVFITHRLAEVRALADQVTVLRGGEVVASYDGAAAKDADLARDMVGDGAPSSRRAVDAAADDLGDVAPWAVLPRGEPVLVIRGLDQDRPGARLREVDLDVRAGEVVGVAGVDGNGQGPLLDVLMGLARPDRGEVSVLGESLETGVPGALRALGAAIIPGDRHTEGLALGLSVEENLVLSTRALRALGRPFKGALRARSDALLERFGVRAPPTADVATLSGGNQQRIVLARELDEDLPLLILAQPTRGLDVAASAQVHRAICAARSRGAAVLLVSTDLDEILALSDRVVVMFDGAVAARFDGPASRAAVGRAMAGGVDRDRPAVPPVADR